MRNVLGHATGIGGFVGFVTDVVVSRGKTTLAYEEFLHQILGPLVGTAVVLVIILLARLSRQRRLLRRQLSRQLARQPKEVSDLWQVYLQIGSAERMTKLEEEIGPLQEKYQNSAHVRRLAELIDKERQKKRDEDVVHPRMSLGLDILFDMAKMVWRGTELLGNWLSDRGFWEHRFWQNTRWAMLSGVVGGAYVLLRIGEIAQR